MTSLLAVDDLAVEVTRKRVRHLNLSIHPEGRVRVSAPHRTSDSEIAEFVASRRQWIDRHRDRLRREAPAVVSDGAVVPVWGEPHRISVVESGTRSRVVAPGDGTLSVRVAPGATAAARRRALDAWQRRQVAGAAWRLIAGWEGRIGVGVATCTVRRMSSRWGSANPGRGRITLNLELAAHPPQYLEYVVVHEMVHLIETGHGRRFQRLMDRHLPEWKRLRRDLNRGLGQPDPAA
ncbi:MAG: M48 family metallopeptidase [Acidimicrobiia bacterium]|nr:M48 family metallopeptidase [Acidimicrobiia bacterium]